MRELALQQAGVTDATDEIARSEAAFRALALLADPDWHAARSH